VLTGGKPPGNQDRGYFYLPTVLADVLPDLPVFEEEVFGPVMPIVAIDDLAEEIALANQTPYGLAAYVWTNDLRAAVKASEGLHFGMVGINEWSPHGPEAPFAGWKQSGVGTKAAVKASPSTSRASSSRLVGWRNIQGPRPPRSEPVLLEAGNRAAAVLT
jgi:acyl-CoA reductase-like NAD-dependent aldehyde dehydrogenase